MIGSFSFRKAPSADPGMIAVLQLRIIHSYKMRDCGKFTERHSSVAGDQIAILKLSVFSRG